MIADLVVICIDCGDEFDAIDGWLDRCAVCCAVRDDHLSGLHTSYAVGCFHCDASSEATRADAHAA